VILTKLETLREKSILVKKLDAEVILEDRGHLAIYASCIALCMQRRDYSFCEADSYVLELNKNIECIAMEDLHVHLKFSTPDRVRAVTRNRV